MITLDDKLELFSKIILKKIEAEYRDQLTTFEAMLKSEEEEVIAKAEEKAKTYAEDMLVSVTEERRKRIAKARSLAKSEVLKKNEEIFLSLKKELLAMAKVHYQDPAYQEVLQALLKRDFDQWQGAQEIVIRCHPEEASHYQQVIRKLGFQQDILIDQEQDLKGGLIIVDPREKVRYNYSPKVRIEEASNHIGKRLHDLLLEIGEEDE